MSLSFNNLQITSIIVGVLFLVSCSGNKTENKGAGKDDVRVKEARQGFESQAENVKTIF